MSKFNTGKPAPRAGKSPLVVVSARWPTDVTHTGGPAFTKSPKMELFTLGVNLLAGNEDTFHEKGKDRDSRFNDLCQTLAVEEPQWLFDFLTWLRNEGNIRTASVMGAVDAAWARLHSSTAVEADGFNRKILASVPSRLDEVPELFAIWEKNHGKPFPAALKRGAGDALKRLLNQYSYQKYDAGNSPWRISDVIELAHVKPESPEQEELFRLAIADRHGSSYEYNSEVLDMIAANRALRKDAAKNPRVLLDPDRLKAAGFTWNNALSLAGNAVPKGKLWDALLLSGSVGYMAMLRNLRNLEQAGISKESTEYVISRLTDPRAVARSRQFPYAFYLARREAQGSQWVHPLEVAFGLSVQNIPELSGRTLILIDQSGSMWAKMSGKSKMGRVEAATLYGIAVATKNAGNVDVYAYANYPARINVPAGASVLRLTEKYGFNNDNGLVTGGGTETAKCLAQTYEGHDRVKIFTDEQSFRYAHGGVSDQVPDTTWLYSFDLAGYSKTDIPAGFGRRYQLGGLTDHTFKLPLLLESGHDGKWPWEK